MSLFRYRFRTRSVWPLLGLSLATCVLLFLCVPALAFASPRLPTQQAKLTASDAAVYNQLGYSVALDGDTAVVGDPYETVNSQSHAGAVYVYTWSGTSWAQQAELTASDLAAGDWFGASVAISGDTAVVGALFKSVGGQGSAGAAYVFTRSGTSWSQQTKLSDPDATYEDDFGTSVALDGNTALIGAPGATVGAVGDAGAAYVYARSGTSWSQPTELTNSDAADGDEFGYSVALDGDTALVGAYDATVNSLEDAGAAYVFTGAGTSWSEQTELTASDPAGNDEFGMSVALHGSTALIGAPDETVGGYEDAGAGYVFTGAAASWLQQAKLTASDPAHDDDFGYSVAVSGDTAVVGAPYKTVASAIEAGAAYVFTRAQATWSQETKLSDPEAADGDEFGTSVARSGDRALIGAYGTTIQVGADSLSGAGAAYVYVVYGDDTLRDLTVSSGALTPSFATAHLSYADTVAHSVTAITVTPTLNDAGSSYALKVGGDTVTDPIALNVGVNVIDVVVTAQNLASETYVLTVTRLSNDDTLSNLTVSAGTLSPPFAAATLGYTDDVANSVSTITVTPTVNESHATYVLKVGSTTVTNPVALSVGDNVIDVQVTAQDGSSQTYSVTVTRALLIPKLTLKLSGPKHGVLKLGKSLTAKGTTSTSLAGGTVTLTVQRKQGSKWLKVTSLRPTINAKGAYSVTYKPAKKGSYRIEATVAKTATSTAAASKWLTFKVVRVKHRR
jgi:hypothetical protein